ncbi:hypothetical protein [Rhodocaloribacter sp.]
MKAPLIMLAVLPALLGCGSLDASEPEPTADLFVTEPVVQGGKQITAIIRNRGESPLLVPVCGRIVMEIEVIDLSSEGWTEYRVLNQICPALYSMAPIEVAPGADLNVYFSLTEKGIYRLVIPLVNAPPLRSAAFVVK